MKSKLKTLLLLIIILMTFTSCADSQNNIQNCLTGYEYGFWSGVWHGACSPFSFIGSLFSKNIAVFAINNNGSWYMFGFLLGAGTLGFGTEVTIKNKRNK